ncbi:MAG: DUF3732 domain-containing protein [Fimbriimonadaceae bacterium]|nr:DUF3732 domain-containing protein [Fimbriimonadaceae bacterium]
MSRWQIKSLAFYSHHGSRRDLIFDLSAVNIIVGESNTGKSAIIEAIDYAMGAGECHIPGIVRERCSWVGVCWVRDKTEVFICRRVVQLPRKSSEDVFYSVGPQAEIPPSENDLRKRTNTDGALRQFEQAMRMGNVTGQTFTERQGNRISLRNALPYVLVSDDVILDKLALLRGMNDERRLSITDSIPYFLGAVDESTAANEVRLKKLRAQLEREERRRESARTDTDANVERGAALLEEALNLGMVQVNPASESGDDGFLSLRTAATWAPTPQAPVAVGDRLAPLNARERQLQGSIANLRSHLNAAEEMLTSANGFAESVRRQQRKLDVSSVFKVGGETDVCPVCENSITTRTEPLNAIQAALTRLGGDLEEVTQDRPQIDDYIAGLREQMEGAAAQLVGVREQIAGIIREDEQNAGRIDLDQRRMRVAGRISYFLDTILRAPAAEEDKLEDLRSEIEDLESLVDPEAKTESLNALQLQVSTHASSILKDLPIDENYRDVQAMFDARKVRLQFIRGNRVMDMRDVGGDESCLSGRLSAVLGLHRVFAGSDRPVPGVVIFDQLSRPFYSPEANPGEVQIVTSDKADLKKYFDTLFDEVTQQKTLQVIVLEHAYFADFDKYKAAVKYRWGSQEKLVPFDWPDAPVEDDDASDE